MSATNQKQQSFVASIRTACRQASRIGTRSLKALHIKKLEKMFDRPQNPRDTAVENTNIQQSQSRIAEHSFLAPANDLTPASTPGVRRTLTVHNATLAALEQQSPDPVMHSVRFCHPMVGGVASSLPSPATAIAEQYSPVDYYRFQGGEDTPMTEDFPEQVNPTSIHRRHAATTSYAETVAALDGVRGFSAMITQPRDHGTQHTRRTAQQGRPPTLPCLPYMDPQIPASAFDDPPENEYLSVEEIRQAALDRLNAIATPSPEPAVKAAHPISLHPGALVFSKSRHQDSTPISAYRDSEMAFSDNSPGQGDELEQLYASLTPAATPDFPASVNKKRGTRMYEQHQSLLLSPMSVPDDAYSVLSATPDFPPSEPQSDHKNRKSMLQKQYQDLSFTPSAPASPSSIYSTDVSGKGPTPQTPAYGYPGLPTARFTVARKGVRQPPLRPKNPSPPPTPPARADSVSEFSFSYLQHQPESIRATTSPSDQSKPTSPPGLSYSSSTTTASSKLPSPAAIAAAKALWQHTPSSTTSSSKRTKELNIHELAGIKTGRLARVGAEAGSPALVTKTHNRGKGKGALKELGWKQIVRKVVLKEYGEF